ncbi:MAG: Hint domain-containing protein, partial [Proteobacteria bacterium]|nr:Hint domain-containing protein [Pseudomonadota bacterium]
TATRFGYDARQRRVVKAGPNETTIYVDNLYERMTTSTRTTHLYHVLAPTGPIATIQRSIGLPGTDEIRFVLADRLGSARTIIDSDGKVVARQRFTAFGKRETALDPGAGHRGFTGHEHDPDLGLVNMRGRMYDPAIGRFLSIDPILHTPFASQGTNAYSYVYNNPLSFRDPSGLSPDNVQVVDFSDCPTVIVAGADEIPDQPCPPKSGSSGNGASASGTSSSQGTTGSGNRTQPGSAETTAHQPGATGTGDGEPGGGHSDPSTASGRPDGSPHGVSYGKAGGAEEVPLFAGIGLFNTALGRWLSSFKVKASTKAALDGASILAAVFTGVTSFVAKLAKKAVRAGTKALGGAFRRFKRPGGARRGLRGCFVAGTLVETEVGSLPIEQIREGDLVLARDEENGTVGYQRVSATFVREGIEIYELTVNAGCGATELLETTAEHPFWVVDRGWVDVADLGVGDELLDASGGALTVSRIVATGRTETVHNIEVEGYHTYFVGELKTWVHNKAALNPKILKQIEKAGLPQTGDIPFRPATVLNKKGNPIIKKAEITYGPKAGKKGYVDQEGRIWIRDRAHGNHADHWDVQIDGGQSYINVGMNGNFSH